MQKTVTLRCTECGKTYAFTVGAGARHAHWRDIIALIRDKKDVEKLTAIYASAAEKRSKAALSEFVRNPADAFVNIDYGALGEKTVKLFSDEDAASVNASIGEKAGESIASSKEKWQAAAQKEGITALDAIYICPKSHRPKQGLYVSVRYKDDKQNENVFTVKNKCDDCSADLELADDGNIGFMHEGCPTAALCESCSAKLAVDGVSFKIPQKEEK